jgi:hypothetical protein
MVKKKGCATQAYEKNQKVQKKAYFGLKIVKVFYFLFFFCKKCINKLDYALICLKANRIKQT